MPISNIPIATIVLAILNTFIFAYGLLSGSQEQIIRNYGFIPGYLFHSNDSLRHFNSFLSLPLSVAAEDALMRLFSSIFIHTNIVHLAFNMLALVYLGGYAERSVGVLRYVVIYILAGVLGALFYGVIATFILGNGYVVLIGASGAISGIIGIAAATGNTQAYYWILLQIIFAVVGSVTSIPIAFTAHIGGFIAGLSFTKVFVSLDRIKRTRYWSRNSSNYSKY
jgi:rhomboid protease GluP